MTLVDPKRWYLLAACRGRSDINWFPRRGAPLEVHAAYAVCAGCPVKAECLAYAFSLEFNPPGVWGGTSAHQRKTIRRERRVELKAKAS